MSAPAVPALHVPDEPTAWAERWSIAVRDGRPLDEVLAGAEGLTSWLWSRWRSLAATGVDEMALAAIVLGFRREIWLWLSGERAWQQCCSGLIGRVVRRVPARPAAVT